MKITTPALLFGTCRARLPWCIVFLVGSAALAQEEPNRVAVFFEYSHLRFNPTIPRLNNRSFNGGGAELRFYFTRFLALKAELMGYGSTTRDTTVDPSRGHNGKHTTRIPHPAPTIKTISAT
jgi:hypothetical protein